VTPVDLLAGLAIAVGLVGILVPVLPGSVLIVAGVLASAAAAGTGAAWLVFGLAAAIVVAGAVVKYVVPSRRLGVVGIPASTQLAGGVLGLVGFFVVPVIGLVLGFIAGVYLAELRRVGSGQAWPSTWHALKAAGLAILIELAAGVAAAAVWVAGVVTT
jgi:uncharacterized protein YqgC (DUF456 family)